MIITQKQVDHIRERHPEIEEEDILPMLRESVEDPDIVLRDVHEGHAADTAIVMKKMPKNNTRVILRFASANDPEEWKNSIITAMIVSEKRWKTYIANREVLYKRPGFDV